MTQPKAYDPQDGCMFQILTRYKGSEWEHCDYAKDIAEKNYLLGEYQLAYKGNFDFKIIKLPRKYWPKKTLH